MSSKIFRMENILLELFGILLPAAIGFAAVKNIPLAPIFSNYDKSQNDIAIIAIPSILYISLRIYFGLVFAILSYVPAIAKPYTGKQ
jgi:hypothetical protein